jgi:hypothetical protein
MSMLIDMRSVQVAVHCGKYKDYLPPDRLQSLRQSSRIEDLEQSECGSLSIWRLSGQGTHDRAWEPCRLWLVL